MTGLAVSLLAVSAVSGEAKKSGPLGLAVILLLCVACYFLFKSMSRHLRKVREQYPTDEAPPADPPARPTDASAETPGAPAETPDAAPRPDQPS